MWQCAAIYFCTLVFEFKPVHGLFPKVFVNSEQGARSYKWHNASQSVHIDETRPPMLELMSLNLQTWGANTGVMGISSDGVSLSQDTLLGDDIDIGHANPLAAMPQSTNMFDSLSFQAQVEPLNFITQGPRSPLVNTLMFFIFLLVAILMVGCLLSLCFADSEGDDTKEVGSPTKRGDKASPSLSDPSMGESSWARAYLEAKGEQKDAFELLFRCNIISTEEFACSVISEEHIQECTWIAMHMLQHRPLEEWVALWQQAQQTFEDSVAECFEARGGQIGFTARSLAQRLKISRNQYVSPSASSSMPSSANLDFVSQDPSHDFRPLQS